MNRIDDIFSPEKMRKSWKSTPVAGEIDSETASLPSTKSKKVHDEFERLEKLANQRFHGEHMEALNIMMFQLKDLLTVKFPDSNAGDAGDNVSRQDNETLDPAIEELLDQIEEFIDALGAGDI